MENYRIYSREPIYFIRIILIAMAIFSFIMPIFIIFSIALLFIIIRDFKKCKSYIEFADSGIIIDDYQWWFLWTKHVRLEIPYDEIAECKRLGSGFSFYLKNWKNVAMFSVEEPNCGNEDVAMFLIEKSDWYDRNVEYIIKKIFKEKGIKYTYTKKGLFNF